MAHPLKSKRVLSTSIKTFLIMILLFITGADYRSGAVPSVKNLGVRNYSCISSTEVTFLLLKVITLVLPNIPPLEVGNEPFSV